MKNKIMILGALLLTMAFSSCHKDADVLLNYAYNDNLAFSEASESYAGKFRVFWKAMNQNYTLWDYEEEYGLDWDAVYDEYLPKFEALDEPDTEVSDEMLRELMEELVAPLHDGHMSVGFKNHQTGNTVIVSPGRLRNSEREDVKELDNFTGNISYYKTTGELKRYMSYNSSVFGQLIEVMHTPGKGIEWVKSRLSELLTKSSLTQSEIIEYEQLNSLFEQVKALGNGIDNEWFKSFNDIVSSYSHLNVPFLEPIDLRFKDYGMALQYAMTKDNIAYLQLSQFSLSAYLDDKTYESLLGGSAYSDQIRQKVVYIWKAWFNSIQELHKNGQLEGVIIDVRNNPGGMMRDAIYVLGALLPAGGVQYGWARFKRGVGRYDFSPMTPQYMETMDTPHEIIDDLPIVVLANSSSVSMSEMTSLTAKQVENAVVMGRTTYGGLCGLVENSDNSYNYSGHIGESGVTPIHVYLPTECIFDINKKALEGIGVTPDIEVPFDGTLFKESGRDSQFERALQYIRTGK